MFVPGSRLAGHQHRAGVLGDSPHVTAKLLGCLAVADDLVRDAPFEPATQLEVLGQQAGRPTAANRARASLSGVCGGSRISQVVGVDGRCVRLPSEGSTTNCVGRPF